jgi:hypothetical protein
MKVLILGVVVCLGAIPSLVPAVTPVSADIEKVLWRDPGPIGGRDLYWGAGSAERAPKPPFRFVQENLSGTKPKLDVTDAAGVAWSMKLAPAETGKNEVHAEIAAARLLWAFGYFVDENYFVPSGRIEGVRGLKRAASVVGTDGSFEAARFARRESTNKRLAEWHLENNAFKGTRELGGFQTLMLLIASWDAIPSNTAVMRVTLPDGRQEDRYLVTDLGSSFGRMRGGQGKSPSRWALEDYRESSLVNGIVLGNLQFRAPLLGNKPLAIPLAHARWFATAAGQLTDQQIRRAFEAAGASPAEIDGFSAEVRKRIREITTSLSKSRP